VIPIIPILLNKFIFFFSKYINTFIKTWRSILELLDVVGDVIKDVVKGALRGAGEASEGATPCHAKLPVPNIGFKTRGGLWLNK
jgi:hypothetical protein